MRNAPSPGVAPLKPVQKRLTLPDLDATTALGRRLAATLRRGDAVCLWGDLGAGKTALARGTIQALLAAEGRMEEVPSPTFTLVQTYEMRSFELWHFDLYRLSDPEEVIELGLEEALESGVSLIEWPDRLGPFLPAGRLDIELALAAGGNTEGRTATLTAHDGGWTERLDEL